MRQSLLKAAIAATSTLLLAQPAFAQGTGLTAAIYQGCYSSSPSFPLTTSSDLTYEWQSSGWCQTQCGKTLQKAVYGLTKGSDCWCGDKLPANATKVADSQCNTPCQGFGSAMCGGQTTFSVFTSGITNNVESVDDSSASSSSSAPTSTDVAQKESAVPSTITQAGKTIVVTATSSPTTAADGSKSSSSSGGTSKAAIAAGVVVGVAAIAAIAGGVFFLIRHRRRRQIEEEHRRGQETSNFAYSGTVKSRSEASTADSRLDPSVHYRRQSDGSIADERDFTRRVLQVTNPDRS